MKSTLLLVVAFLFLGLSQTKASFPVNKEKAVEAVQKNQVENDQIVKSENNFATLEQVQVSTNNTAEAITPVAADSGYNKWVALAFWAFLNWPFAAHRWYAHKPAGWNILYILTLGGVGIWSIFDLVNILMDNF